VDLLAYQEGLYSMEFASRKFMFMFFFPLRWRFF
jgi:hypothetical protein